MQRPVPTVLLVLAASLALSPGCSTRDPCRPAVPVYETVEVPIRTRKAVPAHRIRFIPRYEMVEEPVRRGDRQVGTRTCRRFAGYDPEEVQIGWRWETVETGTREMRVLRGWRYADDPPWSCETPPQVEEAE